MNRNWKIEDMSYLNWKIENKGSSYSGWETFIVWKYFFVNKEIK